MNDETRIQWRAFRHTRWGPAEVVVRRDAIEARVGEAVVELDLTDRRPAAERQAEPWRSVFVAGVPVSLAGRQVATITREAGSPGGLLRRERFVVEGDPGFVLPGLRFTNRALPHLLTLRSDAGVLVTSRRWAGPLNTAVTEWSFVREYDLVPPRVGQQARDEHIALWMAMKEGQRT